MSTWPWLDEEEPEDELNIPECEFCEISCGCRQLVGVSDMDFNSFKLVIRRQEAMAGLSHHNSDDSFFRKGFIYIFSDNKRGNGRLVAKWIKKYKLGTLISSPWALNPNSKNFIKVWTWRYNGRSISARAQEA